MLSCWENDVYLKKEKGEGRFCYENQYSNPEIRLLFFLKEEFLELDIT